MLTRQSDYLKMQIFTSSGILMIKHWLHGLVSCNSLVNKIRTKYPRIYMDVSSLNKLQCLEAKLAWKTGDRDKGTYRGYIAVRTNAGRYLCSYSYKNFYSSCFVWGISDKLPNVKDTPAKVSGYSVLTFSSIQCSSG